MKNSRFVLSTMVLALAGSVLVFLGVGMLLADEWTVTTTHTIPYPRAAVAERVVDVRAWERWSELEFALGADTARSTAGTAGEAGQELIWRGPLGEARIELTRVADDAVDYVLGYRIGPDGETSGGRYTGTISWRQVKGDDGVATEVSWTEHGKLDSLIARWSSWFGALQERVREVQGASLTGIEEDLRRG